MRFVRQYANCTSAKSSSANDFEAQCNCASHASSCPAFKKLVLCNVFAKQNVPWLCRLYRSKSPMAFLLAKAACQLIPAVAMLILKAKDIWRDQGVYAQRFRVVDHTGRVVRNSCYAFCSSSSMTPLLMSLDHMLLALPMITT